MARRRLRPTLVAWRAAEYRRPGGPWDGGTLDDLCRSAVLSAGGGAGATGTALVDGPVRLDAAALDELAGDLAGRLRAAGVRRGSVVAWQLSNGLAPVALYRACWRLGAVAAPLHHRLGAAEVAAALAQVEPVVVVADPGLPAAEVVRNGGGGGGGRGGGGAPHLVSAAGVGGAAALLDLFAPAPAPAVAGAAGVAGPADLAVCLFTSGSTGTPKAALHTHRSLAYKARLMARLHGLRPGDAVLAPAPLAHVSGLLNGVLISAVTGGACVLMDAWDPERGLSLLEAERVAFVGAPPVFFSQMAAVPGFSPARVAALRLISTGGASVSPAFVDATAEAFCCRVKRTYGSTEAPTVATSGPDDPPEHGRDTDGRATGAVEIETRDPASGRPVAPGGPGELWIRGPELFCGYADAGATEQVLGRPGRWYRSGDLGVLDAQGWLRVVGRISDVIIRAGENISASEVESALEAHPDVRQAVCVGVPDERVGERVAAFVVASAPFGLDECRAWFAARGVTRFKTPEVVVRLDEIPSLAAGKPDRSALRALARDMAPGAGGTRPPAP